MDRGSVLRAANPGLRRRDAAYARTCAPVELADGRSIVVPLAWYPRLAQGSAAERGSWRLLGGGRGIHWPALDEDISVANLLAGQPSAESQSSFKKWLAGRPKPGRSRRKRPGAEPDTAAGPGG